MSNQQFKLIVLDLDGTIVNTDNQISKKTIEVLHEVKKQGVQIIIATGRSLGNSLLVLKESNLLSLIKILIVTNGAIIYDQKQQKIIESKMLLWKSMEIGVEIAASEQMALILTPIDLNCKEFLIGSPEAVADLPYGEKYLIKSSLMDLKGKKISSGIAIGSPAAVIRFEKKMIARTDLKIVSGSLTSTQFSTTTKGSALQELVLAEKIDPKKVLVIGDSPNDISMFDLFPNSVAMGNSFGGLKKKARFLTTSISEDGACLAIRHFVFGQHSDKIS